MDTSTPSPSTAASAAHLSILAGDETGKHAPSHRSALHRLLALCALGTRRENPPPLSLRIVDLQGRQVFALDGAALPIEARLPAGTYHITACRGVVRRHYTMTLACGASSDLYLRLAADRL